jgi:hypothetical protein
MLSAGSIITSSFGFVRETWKAIAIWGIVYMAGALAMSIIGRPLYAAQMQMMAAGGDAPPPPGFFTGFALLYAVMILMFIVLFSAAYRAVLQPERDRAAYLRLGMDELRLFGLIAFMILGAIIGMLLLIVVAAVLIGGLVIMFGAGAGWLTFAIAYALMIGLALWAMVRLSIAGPLTLLRGKITIREAWRLTRGRFWTLFGGYLGIMLIVFLALLTLTLATTGDYVMAMIHAAGDPAETARVAQTQMERFAVGSPMWLLMLVIGAPLMGIAVALQGAMTAIAARGLLEEAAE